MIKRMCYFATMMLVALSAVVPLSRTLAAPMFDEDADFKPQLPQPDLIDPRETENIKKVLELMAAMGDNYMATNGILKKQYIVVAVLSKTEFDQEKIDLPENRTKIILNRNMTGLPEYYNTRYSEVHGEILALYFDKTIEVFLGNLPFEGSNLEKDLPYVFVYSFYIPCAGLSNIHYSCAEELANTARVNEGNYKMVVGFNQVWQNTNVDLAFSYLEDVYALVNMTSRVKERFVKLNKTRNTYQENMCNCYVNKSNINSRTAACLINTITKYCTRKVQLHGRMTQLGKAKMDECMKDYIQESEQKPGYERKVGHALAFCSARTLDSTKLLVLGKPYDMDNPRWEFPPDDVQWADLYPQLSREDHDPVVGIDVRGCIHVGNLRKECTVCISSLKGSKKNDYQIKSLERLRSDIKSYMSGSQTRKGRNMN